MDDPQKQLDGFLAKFTPQVEALARDLLARMKARLPGASILVYDNYNALAIGFSPTEKSSQAVLSLAVYPRWVNLFFLQGARLPDPDELLRGSGGRIRHVRLHSAEAFDDAGLERLIAEAVARADPPFSPEAGRRLIIKSVLPNQRPRRPSRLAPAAAAG
jgi:hypothetical protein